MKKAFKFFGLVMVGSLLFFTSCNTDSDNTPQDYYDFAAVQSSSVFPYKDYLVLADGTKLLPKTTLPSTVSSGDLVFVVFSKESEHVVNDTNQFRYTIVVSEIAKQTVDPIKTSRLDTLGNAAFTQVFPYSVGDFMVAQFRAYGDNYHRFFIAKDSVALVGTSYGLVRNDTMFLEVRHKAPSNTYNEGVGYLFANLRDAINQSQVVPTDSVTISVKYNVEGDTKPNYKYMRFKANSSY